jgi:hypothetical protein
MSDLQPDWLTNLKWTWIFGPRGFLCALSAFALMSALILCVLIMLPADLFDQVPSSRCAEGQQPVRWARLIGKKLLGVVLVLIGVVLSLPGVPGPGLLLVLIGLTLLGLPGKQRLQRALAERTRVLRAINSLRKRCGKAPLVLGGSSSGRDGCRQSGHRLSVAGSTPRPTSAREWSFGWRAQPCKLRHVDG